MEKTDTKNRLLVELKQVTKAYAPKKRWFAQSSQPVLALNSIDLGIEHGEIFGLVGQSGSGKTTTGRLLAKLESPTAGEIYFDKTPISQLKGVRLKAYRSRVQMIFQDPYQSLNPHLSIAETVLEPLMVQQIGTPATRMEKVVHTLDLVGLSPGEAF
jgi:peptide/nickel transport system ATP-binding protein